MGFQAKQGWGAATFRQRPAIPRWLLAACRVLPGLLTAGTARGAELSVVNGSVSPGSAGNVVVSGVLTAESTFGVTILVEIVPRAGNLGTVVFTPAPPADIVQSGDPWPGAGTFTAFDTNTSGLSATLNGSVDDNGTFVPGPVTFSGPLTSFPVLASSNAAGIWDVLLTTSSGDSVWEGLATTLQAGTITVISAVGLTVNSFNLPPGGPGDLVVSGTVNGQGVFGVTILVEIIPRAGAIGTVTFTPAPPADIVQRGDPWSGVGTFTAFDTNTSGLSVTLNGSVDDNGTFVPGPVTFSGPLTAFPVVASSNAGGVWDVVLSTSSGDSTWEGAFTVLTAGTITVTPGVGLTVESFAVPPGRSRDLVVNGNINARPAFGVTILVELTPRAGAVGNVTFTPAPPTDILQRGDPWASAGTFTAFDTDSVGSLSLNGSVDDNGTFVDAVVTFSGPLTAFPITVDAGASGVWDVSLTTSSGASGWDAVATLTTVLADGTITVTAGACITNSECNDGNQCTTDLCNAGVCQNPPFVGSCTDGNACTVGDVCVGTTCQSGPVVNCLGAGGQCNLATCNPAGLEGNCSILTPLPNGTSCSDNSACTLVDLCQAGVCIPGLPVDCSAAGDQCNSASCDPGGALGNCIILTPVLNGTPCNDAVRCNIGETCQGGVCLGGSPVDCTGAAGPCNNATCDPLGTEGNCAIVVPIANGTACSDGNGCTLGETCLTGVCGNGTPVDCSSFNTQCSTATCDPAGSPGNCAIVTPQPDGTVCTDGLFCTATDGCVGGICVGTGNPCTGSVCDDVTDACVQCLVDTDCNDNNLCTDDTCVTRTCVRTNNTLLCNDGSACTANDRCTAGACAGGTTVDCSGAGDTCNVASCNPGGAPNNCAIITPRPNGSPCSDGNRCTVGDTCQSAVCVSTPTNCTSLDTLCSLGMCNSTNGTCIAVPRNNGVGCDDGLPCTTGDVCLNGLCRGTLSGTPVANLSLLPSSQTVVAGQMVRVDLVAASGTCATQPVGSIEAVLNWNPALLRFIRKIDPPSSQWVSSSFPNDSALDQLNAPYTGVPASDGNAWYQALANFQIGADAPPTGIVVTSFEFQALDGVLSTPVTMPASGGTFARTRVLGAGATIGIIITGSLNSASVRITECAVAADCNDNNLCTTDTCSSGICGYSNNSLSCNDGLFCTPTDTCVGGACVGSGVRCSAGQFCNETLDACVQCLTNAHCDDANVCTTDTCSPTGTCQRPNNNAPCNDNLFCTALDQCSGGTCVGVSSPCTGGTPVCDEPGDRCVQCLSPANCNDNNVCTTDSCTGNVCGNAPNTLPCSDGQFCTPTDVCALGACTGTGTRCTAPQLCHEGLDACVQCLLDSQCNDGNPCTTDVCSAAGACQNTNNNIPCDDGQFCSTTDTCNNGVCLGGGGPRCPGQLCDEPNDRCVQCFTLANCPNDNIACTVDTCTNGACLHTPDNPFCSDGVFCNGVETCSTALGCQPAPSPCDDPGLCNESTDSCACQPPEASSEGSRYIAVRPLPGQTQVALLVTGASPGFTCLNRYVRADGTLGPTPVFRPPSGPTGWNTMNVRSEDIQPSTNYVIQAECDTLNGIGRSTPVAVSMWRWADTDHSGGLVSILDVTYILDGFRSNFTQPLPAVDLWGQPPVPCRPQGVIDISDVTVGLDAFRQLPFPCSRPCP